MSSEHPVAPGTPEAAPHTADGATAGRMPAIYLSHGAPPLADDALWTRQLADWSAVLPRPASVLMVSAHWESAPLAIGATTTVPLVYDFWGFEDRYYQVTYPAPGAPGLAADVRKLLNVGHLPGSSLHHELDLLVQAGLTPAEALQAATLVNARALHLDDKIGTVAAGKRADLLLVRGDPTASLDALHQIQAVYFEGRAVQRGP